MTATRLGSVNRYLADLLARADDVHQRRAAEVAAEFALDHSGLTDGRIDVVVRAIRSGSPVNTSDREAVRQLSTELDEIQWNIQGQLDSGNATQDEHLRAFSLARAATALYYAADPDPKEAALESVYEAGVV